ncbi:hypothetical protein DPV78_001145 [Talaromyces pinophilus]|nr:hypothetical protein DPV78_001145 [Talaromyces pinophilus]
MELPKLGGDPLIDDIIIKCWHNKYATIADLAAYTKTLLPGKNNWRDTETEKISTPQWRTVISRVIRGLWKRFRSWLFFVLCSTSEATKPKEANGGDWMAIAVASDHTAQQRISLPKNSARTWRRADSSVCSLWESQSNLDSVSSGIDIPQVEAKAKIQISTKEKSKALTINQQGGKAYRHEDYLAK